MIRIVGELMYLVYLAVCVPVSQKRWLGDDGGGG